MAACALGSDNEMGMAGLMGGAGSGGATKFDKAAAMAAGRKWGNIVQAAPNRNRLGMSSGQSTMSEEENDQGLGSSSVDTRGGSGLKNQQSSEDSTLTLNDGVMSRQSSAKGQSTQSSASASQPHQRKDTKYSKSRSPIMQSLNPTQLQPPSSILKAEVRAGEETTSSGDNSHRKKTL